MGFGSRDVDVSLGVRDSAALHSLCHVCRVRGLVDVCYVDRLAFIRAMIGVQALLVGILLATPLAVPVLTSLIGCAVRALDGLVVLLYSRCVACKEEAKSFMSILTRRSAL